MSVLHPLQLPPDLCLKKSPTTYHLNILMKYPHTPLNIEYAINHILKPQKEKNGENLYLNHT